MTCRLRDGHIYWRGSMDTEGYRNYDIGFQVEHSRRDGPANIMQTPGLPLPGSMWLFDDDIDVWAWCTWERDVKEKAPQSEGEPWVESVVNCKFTTRPPGLGRHAPGKGLNHADPAENKRSGCRDFRFEDPLTEPQKIGGAFVANLVEATKDRFGKKLLYPTFEQIRGPQVEFDDSRYSVRIEQNVPILQLNLVTALKDHVNQYPLWGFAERCIKFKNFTWERHYYGSCYLYYTRVFDFEINPDTWDRDVSNDTTKCLIGKYQAGSGSGCRINVDAVGFVDGRFNSITHASVVPGVGGSGYPRSAYVPLALTDRASGGSTVGRYGVVVGVTDANGVVKGLAPLDGNGNQQAVLYGGELYSPTLDVDINTGSGVCWTLTPLDFALGLPFLPTPSNPSHFAAYVDKTGQPARCLVNKAGVPATKEEVDLNSGGNLSTHVEKYDEADLLLLGIPPILEL